jgi:hypothetical protein
MNSTMNRFLLAVVILLSSGYAIAQTSGCDACIRAKGCQERLDTEYLRCNAFNDERRTRCGVDARRAFQSCINDARDNCESLCNVRRR